MPALGLIPDENRLDHYRERMAFNQHRFLECFAICGRVCEAARRAKIHRCQHAEWMQNDPTYPERFRQARKRAAQELEDEAVRRAREGVCRPVLYKGKQVYVGGGPLFEYEKSDRLLIRLLEANDPDRFKVGPIVKTKIRPQ